MVHAKIRKKNLAECFADVNIGNNKISEMQQAISNHVCIKYHKKRLLSPTTTINNIDHHLKGLYQQILPITVQKFTSSLLIDIKSSDQYNRFLLFDLYTKIRSTKNAKPEPPEIYILTEAQMLNAKTVLSDAI